MHKEESVDVKKEEMTKKPVKLDRQENLDYEGYKEDGKNNPDSEIEDASPENYIKNNGIKVKKETASQMSKKEILNKKDRHRPRDYTV